MIFDKDLFLRIFVRLWDSWFKISFPAPRPAHSVRQEYRTPDFLNHPQPPAIVVTTITETEIDQFYPDDCFDHIMWKSLRGNRADHSDRSDHMAINTYGCVQPTRNYNFSIFQECLIFGLRLNVLSVLPF